ncbi:prepilin peptidase [Castellaniella sp.]|uniref:prepilin peptidase n=1 Tax=Castellaniella sp. TaxID=1955812 RepID=UPI003C71A65F
MMAAGAEVWLAMAGVAGLCAGVGLRLAPWAREYDLRLRGGAPATARTLWRAACHACHQPVYWGRDAWGASVTGGLAAGVLAQQGWTGLALLLLVLGLAALAWLDGRSGLLPDALTLPLMVAGWWLGPLGPMGAFGASVAMWGALALAAGLYRCVRGLDGFGGGDVKCLAMLAGWLGWPAALTILWGASVLGLLGWACRPGCRRRAYPFGPYLALATGPWILWPETVGSWLALLGGA